MQIPLQITFRNMDASAAVEADIREKAEKLDQFYSHIMSCRVMVETHHKHHHKGSLYHVRLDITVPGKGDIVISREADEHHAHEDVYVAVRDAFDAARRQLEDHARKERQEVKQHESIPHGTITALNPQQDYGRIQGADGRDIYFHRNSIIDAAFDDLAIGMEVRYAEEQGEEGPQASSVHLIGKHHLLE